MDWQQHITGYGESSRKVRAATVDYSSAGCHLLQATINTIEASLDPEMFLRIHRSLIVNTGRGYHETLKTLASNPV